MVNIGIVILLIILGILGIFDSGYLILKRILKKPLTCPINRNCEEVLDSKWNKLFFIKNDVLGLIYYVITIIFGLYLIFISESFLVLAKIISGLALLTSIFLIFIQFKVLKQYCFYCLVSSVINLFIFLIILIL